MDDGSPNNEPPMNDGRPPGGTARVHAPGNKTPRRVQWATQGLSESPEYTPLLIQGSDLSSRDPDVFAKALKVALERHKSSPNLPRRSTLSSPESPGASSGSGYSSQCLPGERLAGTNARENEINAFGLRVPRFFRDTHKGQDRDKARDHDGLRGEDLEQFAHSVGDSSSLHRGTGVLSTLLGLHGEIQTSETPTPCRVSSDESRLPSSPPLNSSDREDVNLAQWAHPLKSAGASTISLPPSIASLARSVHFPEARPAAARNAGGVVGSLIASTGNLSGPATPIASTIAPNVKRSGYHVSRYSTEADFPMRQEPTISSNSSSPRSMNFSEPMLNPSAEGSAYSESPEFDDEASTSGRSKEIPLKNLPGSWSPRKRPGTTTSYIVSTPASTPNAEYDNWVDWRHGEKRWGDGTTKRRRKKAPIYITRHINEIIQRQEFILKLTRALMMFGAPSHRLQSQIQATGRVLDIDLSCIYLPDAMLISFDDSTTSTSHVKFIRQGSALNVGKLQDAHALYWRVIHDDTSVKDASAELDILMRKKSIYNWWQLILIGSLCSASICSVSFYGSFVDCLASIPLGGLLVAVQLLSVHNELYSNIFELTIATLLSFISAALASTRYFCYTAVASSSVVLILPGFIVLCGSLDIISRNIVSGAVRLCFALMYSLFLGFGLAIGAEVFQAIARESSVNLDLDDYQCRQSHIPDGPWWQRTPTIWWAFLTVPMYSLCLSLRFHAPWYRKELLLLVVISCIGWVTTHFSSLKFQNRSDVSAALGAFTIGFVSNVYGRFFEGNPFVIMITGILFQVPSGLANGGGLLAFVSQQTAGSTTSYLSGFQTALQLISVSVGLTVGISTSLVVVYPVLSRRRAGGVFSL